MSEICPKCGREIDSGSRFCPYCGALLEGNGPSQSSRKHAGKAPDFWKSLPTYQAEEEQSLGDKFFSFRGRMNRKKFVLRNLILYLLNILLAAAELLTEPASVLSDSDAALRMAAETGTVSSLGGQSLFFIAVGVALSLADLTLGIRRSHDLGKSGWYLLWMLVPFANLYVLIKLWCFRGTAGPNRFGPDPLAGAGA